MRVCKAGDNLIKCPHMGDIEDYKKEVEWITDCTKEYLQEAIADIEDVPITRNTRRLSIF